MRQSAAARARARARRGAAVAEELLFGNARYLEGSATTTNKAKGPLATPAAVVVCLTPLPVAAHVLLGCEESSLFVVPCTASGIETLAIGNIEYGCLLLKAKAVLLLGAPTPEFASYVHAAKERKLAKDGPLRHAGRRAAGDAPRALAARAAPRLHAAGGHLALPRGVGARVRGRAAAREPGARDAAGEEGGACRARGVRRGWRDQRGVKAIFRM